MELVEQWLPLQPTSNVVAEYPTTLLFCKVSTPPAKLMAKPSPAARQKSDRY